MNIYIENTQAGTNATVLSGAVQTLALDAGVEAAIYVRLETAFVFTTYSTVVWSVRGITGAAVVSSVEIQPSGTDGKASCTLTIPPLDAGRYEATVTVLVLGNPAGFYSARLLITVVEGRNNAALALSWALPPELLDLQMDLRYMTVLSRALAARGGGVKIGDDVQLAILPSLAGTALLTLVRSLSFVLRAKDHPGSAVLFSKTISVTASALSVAIGATFTTAAAHGLTAGMKITVAGFVVAGSTAANGDWIVATVPTTTTFTVATPPTITVAGTGGTLTLTPVDVGGNKYWLLAFNLSSPILTGAFSDIDATAEAAPAGTATPEVRALACDAELRLNYAGLTYTAATFPISLLQSIIDAQTV